MWLFFAAIIEDVVPTKIPSLSCNFVLMMNLWVRIAAARSVLGFFD